MPKFRKKPIVVEAVQWFKDGDHKWVHPATADEIIEHLSCGGCPYPQGPHGIIYVLADEMTVCQSDWIITGVAGEFYPCKDSIFRATHEEVTAERCGAYKEHGLGPDGLGCSLELGHSGNHGSGRF